MNSRPTIYQCWNNFLRVLFVIQVREARTRYVKSSFGYAIAIFEPVIYLFIIAFAFYLIGRPNTVTHVPQTVFLFTGLLPDLAVTRVWTYTDQAVEANKNLLSHPVVHRFDTYISRFWLELSSSVVVFFIISTSYYIYSGDILQLPFDVLGVLCAIVLSCILGGSLGLLTGSIRRIFPIARLLITPLRRAMFFTAGVFYLPDYLPRFVQDVIVLNPLLHIIASMRNAYIRGFHSDLPSTTYPVIISVVLFTLAIMADFAKERMVTR